MVINIGTFIKAKKNLVKKILQINGGVLIANEITIHKRDALTLKEPQN